MKPANYQQLLETSWTRPLTAEEEAELERCFIEEPGLRKDWELEQALSLELSRLQQPSLSTNFTARTLDAVSRECSAPSSETPARINSFWGAFLRGSWGKASAGFAALLLVGLVSVSVYREYHRTEVAKSVATVATVTSLPTLASTNPITASAQPINSGKPPVPNLELLKDFEPIYRLSQMPSPPVVDDELLAALE